MYNEEMLNFVAGSQWYFYLLECFLSGTGLVTLSKSKVTPVASAYCLFGVGLG